MAANKRKYSQEYLDSQLNVLKNGIAFRDEMYKQKEKELAEWKELALTTMEELEEFDYENVFVNTISLLILERSKR